MVLDFSAEVDYHGYRTKDGRTRVLANGKRLRRRGDLRNHSPDGFEWGYGGSGPAQLALALLADAVGDEVALQYYQGYKHSVVSGWPKEEWRTSREEIQDWLVGVMALEGEPGPDVDQDEVYRLEDAEGAEQGERGSP